MSGTQKGNEHGYAGALYKPASSGNRIPAVDEFKQIRELRTVRDKLYKEIEKLNGRSDVLAQDNTKLRNANFSQQVCNLPLNVTLCSD